MRQLLPLCVLLLLASLAVAPGCNPVDDVTPEDVCDDARRAIGLRTEACTGDAKLADERFERASALKCKARTVEASFYSCSKAILAYPCSTIARTGEPCCSLKRSASRACMRRGWNSTTGRMGLRSTTTLMRCTRPA